ncbi:translocation/assembly module TamB domain-containing protein [Devosia limi]|uniref:Translocation and assembly module TamB n=1 Tax=Devosia limi DSM 17137 TaxID=1121477 RepID=A0A1M4WTG0_9HYPH|nr:translocation/assembly module TamB domain-containing protein [Devosia limi]SHE84526.1 translocation and assembly module TamB [Devosia limi DSM 17137]
MIARLVSLPRRFVAVIIALLALAIIVPAMVVQGQDQAQAEAATGQSSDEDKDWLTSFVQDRLSTPERQIRLSNIDGVLGSEVSIRQITISDAEGVWLRVNNAVLDWNQAALFLGRLQVRSLRADSIDYIRNAVPSDQPDLPSPEAGGFSIPEFPVAIIVDEIAVPQVNFGEDVFGLGSAISLNGSFRLEGGNLVTQLNIVRLDGPGGTLDLNLNYQREGNTIDLGLTLVEPENGVIANLLNIEGRPAVELTLAGSGPVADLRTELELKANGQVALAGVATINQVAEGFSVAADLRGPLSILMAEQYRKFFGAETALSANALVRNGGGVSISGLRVTGGQLSLEAAAETTPDNFLRQLTLDAVIADPAGEAVTLPVPGNATRVGSAQLSIDFGAENSENWTSNLAISQLETTGFAADSVALSVGGVAANLSDPATRRVTFNGDGTVAGISAAPEVEAALGDSIGFGIAGLWNAGEPVQLAELRVVGKALTAVMNGQLDGLDFNGDIALETSSIAPFSDIAGRQLDGALSLKASGSIMPLSGGFSLTLDGTGTNLSIGEETADRLLEGTVQLSGLVARTEDGLKADQFRIENQQVQLLANGTYSSAEADFTFNLNLADLALLSDQASGALAVVGTAKGVEDVINLNLTAKVPSGKLADRALRDGQIGFTGQYNAGSLNGSIAGEGSLDGYRTSLAAGLIVTPEQQVVSDIDFQAAGTRITGGVTRNVTTGLMDGSLEMVSPDVSVAAALALLDAQGSVNAALTLTPLDGKQGATLRGDVKGLTVSDIRVGAADINATISDLFGVPVINGSANASDVAAAGVVINTLNAKATQTGDTTAFDAQARLATGTDLDLAGSLTPIDKGYRLALDRVLLQQGTLTARLAQPTVLTVSGSDVSLDALRFDVGSGSITATGTAGEALNVRLDVRALPLSIANAIMPDLGLAGTIDGTATVSGARGAPRVAFDARGAGINATAIAPFGIAPLTVAANGTFANNVVTLASVSASGAQGLRVTGSGTVPLSGNGLNVSLNGSAPLALANQFVADRGGQFGGTVQLDARVSGSINAPQFSGTVATSGAGYVDPILNLRLQNITGRARLDSTRVVIESLSAGLSTGGSVSATGSIGLTNGFPANLQVALNSARYADGALFVATVSGNLALTGNLTANPLLSGTVLVQEANITVPENLAGGATLIDVDHIKPSRPVVQTLVRAQVDDRTGAPIPQSRPAGVILDVMVNAPNQIFIRGRGLDAEVGGSVRLLGPLNDIQPVGGFSLNRGRLSILGQRITFESGEVTLVGDLDPRLNFVARTEGEGITVFVTVSGRASNIDVNFTSNPPLPQDEVLARLIFNRSMNELTPLQLARLAAAAAELVGGGGNGSLMDSLRGAIGLDDLDIVTDAQGNVAVQAGTYLSDNIYLGVTAGGNGQSKVTINLDVTNDLKITGAAGQDGNSSLGVFYERDY